MKNNEKKKLKAILDLVEEVRLTTTVKNKVFRHKATWYHNIRVKNKELNFSGTRIALVESHDHTILCICAWPISTWHNSSSCKNLHYNFWLHIPTPSHYPNRGYNIFGSIDIITYFVPPIFIYILKQFSQFSAILTFFLIDEFSKIKNKKIKEK
jgi:hypothetical protein